MQSEKGLSKLMLCKCKLLLFPIEQVLLPRMNINELYSLQIFYILLHGNFPLNTCANETLSSFFARLDSYVLSLLMSV